MFGKDRQAFELNAGHGTTVYEGAQGGGVKIRVRYDANTPIVEIEATGDKSAVVINGKRVTIGAETTVIEGDIQLDGNVLIAGSLTVTDEIVEGKLREEGSINYR